MHYVRESPELPLELKDALRIRTMQQLHSHQLPPLTIERLEDQAVRALPQRCAEFEPFRARKGSHRRPWCEIVHGGEV